MLRSPLGGRPGPDNLPAHLRGWGRADQGLRLEVGPGPRDRPQCVRRLRFVGLVLAADQRWTGCRVHTLSLPGGESLSYGVLWIVDRCTGCRFGGIAGCHFGEAVSSGSGRNEGISGGAVDSRCSFRGIGCCLGGNWESAIQTGTRVLPSCIHWGNGVFSLGAHPAQTRRGRANKVVID